MKLGILGGTFNPIHYGHLRSAQEVHEMFGLDKTLFIPSGRPPFKKSELAPAHHRYKMIEIAIKDNPLFEVSDIEIKRQKVSYSIDTVRSLAGKYKSAEFFFILGIDAFLDLPYWREPVKLLSLTNLVVISRPGFSFIDLSSSPYLKGVSKKTLRELDRGRLHKFSSEIYSLRKKDKLSDKGYTGKKIFLCKIAGLDISASRTRKLIRTGKSIKYLLPDSVESYIISHKLYK